MKNLVTLRIPINLKMDAVNDTRDCTYQISDGEKLVMVTWRKNGSTYAEHFYRLIE